MVDQPAALSVKLIYIVAVHNVAHDFNLLKSLIDYIQPSLTGPPNNSRIQILI